jgi:hypothetical protein
MQPVQVRRFYLNEVVATESRLVSDRLLMDRLSSVELTDGAPIAVGFDGSVRHDATALVAVDMRSGVAHLLGLWERPPGVLVSQWQVPRQQVRDLVERTFGRFRVVAMDCDPSWWQEDVAAWIERYSKDVVKAFQVNSVSKQDEAVEKTQGGFESGSLLVDSSPASEGLRLHLAAAAVTLSPQGKRKLVKPDDSRRVDAAAALMYAQAARIRAIEAGWVEQKKVPHVW